MRAVLIYLLLACSAAACADEPHAAKTDRVEQIALNERGLTETQEATYQQCLKDHMVVAMAWEVIEQNCLEEASGDTKPLLEQ